MKRNLAIALFAFSTLAAGKAAMAQSPAVQANVPFEFTVGGRLLPAGAYTITSPSTAVVEIQSSDRHVVSMTTASTRGNQQSDNGSKLVFDKYGDQYFLHEIECPGTAQLNVHIPTSKLEKRVKLQEARLEGPQQVFLAAR